MTDYFKLSALTLFGMYQLRRLKKGRGEQVTFTTIGKWVSRFGYFMAWNSEVLVKERQIKYRKKAKQD